ncbi:MAG: ABC transporter substrate-binding protein [Anaerovoracaceae bacterium]|jgi:NitT/TauT family transport system substrate-binding protein
MKKISIVIALLMVLMMSLSGCGPSDTGGQEETPQTPVNVNIFGLKGPTSIGMIKLISEKSLNDDKYNVTYSVVDAPDILTGKIITGEAHIAALPTNTASILYNKMKGDIQFLATNTLGVLSIVGTDNINSIQDLKGKTIISSGNGAVPQYALDYILQQNGLQDSVKVEYMPDHATVAQMVLAGDAKIALLPEPFVTQVTMKDPNVKVLLDVTDEWNTAADNKSVLSMGCLVVNKAFAEANPDFIADFMNLYEMSVRFVNDNHAEAGQLVAEAGIIENAALVEKAIPGCNIVYKDAEDSKAEINGFLKVLYDFNGDSVGGTLPDDNFYYKK